MPVGNENWHYVTVDYRHKLPAETGGGTIEISVERNSHHTNKNMQSYNSQKVVSVL